VEPATSPTFPPSGFSAWNELGLAWSPGTAQWQGRCSCDTAEGAAAARRCLRTTANAASRSSHLPRDFSLFKASRTVTHCWSI